MCHIEIPIVEGEKNWFYFSPIWLHRPFVLLGQPSNSEDLAIYAIHCHNIVPLIKRVKLNVFSQQRLRLSVCAYGLLFFVLSRRCRTHTHCHLCIVYTTCSEIGTKWL